MSIRTVFGAASYHELVPMKSTDILVFTRKPDLETPYGPILRDDGGGDILPTYKMSDESKTLHEIKEVKTMRHRVNGWFRSIMNIFRRRRTTRGL